MLQLTTCTDAAALVQSLTPAFIARVANARGTPAQPIAESDQLTAALASALSNWTTNAPGALPNAATEASGTDSPLQQIADTVLAVGAKWVAMPIALSNSTYAGMQSALSALVANVSVR